MRIVIDMQGAQTESRSHPIGRYALTLAQAIVCNRGDHEVVLALSGFFPDTIEPLRAAFADWLPQDNIRVWYAPGPVRESQPGNEWRRAAAERMRVAFLVSLKPDVLYVPSLFEGYADDAVTGIGAFAAQIPTVIGLYHGDAITSVDPNYQQSSAYARFYQRKVEAMQQAQAWLQWIDDAQQSDHTDAVPLLRRVARVGDGGTVDLAQEPDASADAAQTNPSWAENARKAIAIFEALYVPVVANPQVNDGLQEALLESIGAIAPFKPSRRDMLLMANAIAANHPGKRQKMLYVDITYLVQKDLRTGIQRVTRSILAALLNDPPPDYQIKPVFATESSQGYLHANRYIQQFTGVPGEKPIDEPIDPQPGDVFLGLDLAANIIAAQQQYLRWLRSYGVRVYFVVYDLLPIQLPHFFPVLAEARHRQWLQIVADFDGAICISRAVKEELDVWLARNGAQRYRPFKTDWFSLGADVENSLPSAGIPDDAAAMVKELTAQPSFLMVGTLEPRKGHAQTLQAFELLWEWGLQVNLLIVGNEGWMVNDLVNKLNNHPELNKRLFWLQGVSDEYLARLYAVSACLIAASEGEGFGLPLIEAAKHNLPIIARDIPVFREVAGEHAFYFDGLLPEPLAVAVKTWLSLNSAGKAPNVSGIKWLTWAESARQLMQVVCKG